MILTQIVSKIKIDSSVNLILVEIHTTLMVFFFAEKCEKSCRKNHESSLILTQKVSKIRNDASVNLILVEF